MYCDSNLYIYEKDENDPGNYRPISLLNVASKLYSHSLLQKLDAWAEETQFINEAEAGFQTK